ncbi:hypothetical protein CTI12_AA471670 [Artemisia annua]|uniref:Uncharacterized protein n=1 Tax=Artemisia annua TaxID=35608 RepID=A0A2U1L932_ARTAN|nr:hypothetical protein CTI12_AA471670 [Artemisia annua]
MSLWNYKSTWRDFATFLRPPVDETNMINVQLWNWWNTVTQPLGHIVFRDSLGDMDSCNRVYRWDRKPYQLVFDLGFEARHQANAQVETYFNLENYVNSGGRPLDPIRDTTYGLLQIQDRRLIDRVSIPSIHMITSIHIS